MGEPRLAYVNHSSQLGLLSGPSAWQREANSFSRLFIHPVTAQGAGGPQ